MNKKTKALTTEQYKEIIQTMREGFCGCRPNERIATALVLEGKMGLRNNDIIKLRHRVGWGSLSLRNHGAENRQTQGFHSSAPDLAVH